MGFVLVIFLSIIRFSLSETLITVACQFKEGDRQNCRQYCSNYFEQQPQLGWYNITSGNCEPLKICSWYFHFYDYTTNQCYLDSTLKQIVPSEIPPSLRQKRLSPTFYLDSICVNGVSQSGMMIANTKCFCYFLWQNSGKVDIEGYPFLCDKVVPPQRWKGYFLKDLILDKNGTVIMYGMYTPQQLNQLYSQLIQRQKAQTLYYVYKYQDPLLNLIETYFIKDRYTFIQENQIIWFILGIIFCYFMFAFSYLRYQSNLIKVSQKQLKERIKMVLDQKV